MDPKINRVLLTQIAILEQAIEETPVRNSADVSKGRAIGMLAPKLHAMRAKGYTWREIAAWLTEHGVAMTPSALQRGLRSAKQAPPERAKKGGKASKEIASAADSRTHVTTAQSRPVAPTAAPPVTGPSPARGVTPQPGPGRFIPRRDSEEI